MTFGATINGFELCIINQIKLLNKAIGQNNLRLTTGKRINSAADDPSALVQVSFQRAELRAAQQASTNVLQAKSLVDTADSTLTQVITNLTTIRTKAVEALGGSLTQTQLEANQQTVDSTIDALSGTTFNGKRLLDGSQDFIVSGANSSQVREVQVLDRATQQASQTISVNVSVDATQVQLTHTGASGQIQNAATFSLTGADGSVTITVAQNEALTDVRDRINQNTTTTGVTASVNGDVLTCSSKDYGKDETVAVAVTTGTFAVAGGNGDGTANGVDAQATINGQLQTADGLKFRYRSPSLYFDIELDPSFTTGAINTITVSGKALTFQLDVGTSRRGVLSLPSIHSAKIGGLSGRLDQLATGGGKSLLDDSAAAVNIVDEALAEATFLQARVGSFSGQILGSSANVLSAQEANLTESIATLEGADIAMESALLARNQLLAKNAAAALAIVPSDAANILPLIQQVAWS